MALTGAAVQGFKCKMYLLISSTWTEVGIVNDTVTKNLSLDESELKERGNLETLFAVGHRVRDYGTRITTRYGNTVYDALETAAEAGSVVQLAFTNGKVPTDEDSRGRYGGFVITNFSGEEPIQGFASASVTFKPAVDGPAIANLPIESET